MSAIELADAAVRGAPSTPGRRRPVRGATAIRGSRGVYAPLLAILLVLVAWVLAKAIIPTDGISIAGTRVLPRTDNGAMPWPWAVVTALFHSPDSIPGLSEPSTGITILRAMGFSLRLAAAGFGVSLVFGAVTGLLMFSLKTLERALLPFVLMVPTIPIIVIAPLLDAWSGHVTIFGVAWGQSTTVILVTASLSFWPLAVALVRGLHAPTPQARELMHCLAARRGDVLLRLSLPSAVPYILPALRISAAAAVVSTIVSEISTGLTGGIGALILQYIPQSSSDGAPLYATVIAAGVLGILAVGVITTLELPLRHYLEERRA